MFRSFLIATTFIFSNIAYADIQNQTTWYFLVDMSQADPSVSLVSEDYDNVRQNWVKGNEIIAIYEDFLGGRFSAVPKFDIPVTDSGRRNEETCAISDAFNHISNTYRLCNSSFTQEKLFSSFLQNTIGAVVSVGTAIGHTVSYDSIKFDQFLENPAIKSSIKQTIYKHDIEFVRNNPISRNYQLFIYKYKKENYDPDMMVSQFSDELPKIQAREAHDVEVSVAAAKVEQIHKANESAEEQKRQQAIASEKLQAISNFRKSIKVGDYTNCGLVVNVQGIIIQVQTHKDLRWMKKDEVLPSGYAGYCD